MCSNTQRHHPPSMPTLAFADSPHPQALLCSLHSPCTGSLYIHLHLGRRVARVKER